MKKVAVVINSLYGGGAERILQTVLKNIDTSKYDITLYSLHKSEKNYTCYDFDKIKYKYIFSGNGFFNKLKGKLFHLLPARVFRMLYMRGKYDTEISFIEGESTKLVSGAGSKTKKIAWVHIDLKENPWTDFLYKSPAQEAAVYRRFDKILCVSESVRKAFEEKYDVNNCKVEVHYNPYDKDFMLKKAGEETDIVLNRHVLQIITAGRLVHQKGYDRLLRAVKRLKSEGYGFELHIMGSGEEKKNFEQYIEENKLEKTVYLHGFTENVYPVMKQGDLFICSSRTEGYSTVVAESLIMGLPVVSTACAGADELLGGGQYGMIVPNSEEGIYEGLKNVLASGNILEQMKTMAEKGAERFDLVSNIKQIESIIDA